ncbi:MAG TPA: cytochrome d ubiquinol oxidase subunit II [Frankiaceae bacterium]|nr:cytochrome d ubiquinol oxidase subunit II [Frankiaceae bacterium]
MSAADLVLAAMWVGLTAYALFGGADFGGGWWDLLAGGAEKGAPQRKLIEHSIGPVWEANHVWLIFVLVTLWTGFPTAFAAIMSTLYVPLTLAAFGVILRGSAFAFRKSVSEVSLKRLFGATFALSSVLTPFFLGTVAGAVASGRVPPGNARGDAVTSWLNPTSVLGGTMAVGVCAYLAAVYLCADSRRDGETELAEGFRRRAIVTGAVLGALTLAGVAVLNADAPKLFDGLTGRALPLMVVSALAGVASLVLLTRRDYTYARVTSAIAVTAVIWGWGVGQYPYLLEPSFTVDEAAASNAALTPLLITMGVAAALVGPSLALLIAMFQRAERGNTGSREDA